MTSSTHYTPSDNSEILHLLSFRRTKLHDAVLSPAKLRRNCPLDHDRTTIAPPTSSSTNPFPPGLGDLSAYLPLEIINEILLFLDIRSLLAFRRVNTTALATINSLPEYRAVITHAPDVIRAYVAIDLSSHANIHELFQALTSKLCSYCNSFGAFIFLLECRRVCWHCHTQDPELLPICRGLAAVSFGVSPEALAVLPALRPVSGTYTLRGIHCSLARDPTPLVSRAAARRLAVKVHGSEDAVGAFVGAQRESQLSSYRMQKAVYNNIHTLPYSHPASKRAPGEPAYYADKDNKDDDVRRYQGVAPLPVLNPRTGMLEHGVCCVGCDVAYSKAPTVAHYIPFGRVGWLRRKHEMFGEAGGFLEHFFGCEQAKSIWDAWKEKGVVVPTPEGYGGGHGGGIEVYGEVLGLLQARLAGAIAGGIVGSG
ncbi:hypothetical protein HOY82DRAFT_61870 [Tuber indicum]|nr:hypothetical protein HOY82DRAFT_61870 [Tuber indicum]